MECPKDKSILETNIYETEFKVEICPSCKGMWLDKGELEMIEKTTEHDYSDELSRIPDYIGNAYEMARQRVSREIICPKCAVTMERREHGYCSQIMIDGCPDCGGVWLDKAEITALELFFERSHEETKRMRESFWKSLNRLFRKV